MFKINRKIEYSLMALKHMNDKHPGELSTAKEICLKYHVPFDATARVLQIMSQKGLLKSEHGAHGGYQIIKDLSKVSFFELCEWILGKVKLANCLHKKQHGCELIGECNILSPMLTLNEKLEELYHQLSLKQIIEAKHTAENKIRNLIDTQTLLVV